jgi:hypothetical protein
VGETVNILRRLVEAIERQADIMERQMVFFEAKERAASLARKCDEETSAAFLNEQRVAFNETIRNQAEAVRLQTEIAARGVEADRLAKEHIARCDAVHRRLEAQYGLGSDEESKQGVQ